jgi:hypothetical protein
MEFWKYRSRPVADTAAVAGPPDRRDAFEEGRRQGRIDEKRRHHGHPFVKLAVVAVAVAGAVVVALAAHEGSFSRGGAVVDHKLAVAAETAQVSSAQAVAQAGQAVKDAGTSLEKKVTDASAAKH